MPGVKCADCGHGTNVSFRRGTRLADIPCPECGKTELHTASAGRASKTAGRTYEKCILDGKRSLRHLHPPFEWVRKFSLEETRYPAGAPCCWSHEPVPASRTAPGVVSQSLQAVLGARAGWATDAQRDELEAAAGITLDDDLPCPVCASVGWEDGRFHLSWEAFERGTVLLGHCWRCSHTTELARLEADR